MVFLRYSRAREYPSIRNILDSFPKVFQLGKVTLSRNGPNDRLARPRIKERERM